MTYARFQQKIDTSANWAKATNFIPLEGELIIYQDYDENDKPLPPKYKNGDGVTLVRDLPFMTMELQIPITYNELKELRDTSTLLPGAWYRIIDYQCTTVQPDTRAMNNQFDIIVQALAPDRLSEIAKADYHYNEDGSVDGYFQHLIEGKQILNITWEMSLGANGYDGNGNVTLVELGSEENNEGEVVPVIYKENVDEATGEATTNYLDRFFYIGPYEFNDELYDRWRFIETGTIEDGCHTWDSEDKKFILTNTIVENNAFIISDASEISIAYTMYDDDEGSYTGSDKLDTFVEAGYAENYEGETVPVLYKTQLDAFPETDYNDPIFYIGRYEYNGETYDRWRKIELRQDGWDAAWENPQRYYILTNVVIENNQFMDGVVEESVGDIVKIANLPAWELKYSLDNDTMRFVWADEDSGKGVIYYLKDDWNNECPYDFKNIQFKRGSEWQSDHPEFLEYLGLVQDDTEWFYTFSWINENLEVEDLTGIQLLDDAEEIAITGNNQIKPLFPYAESLNLNNNIFVSAAAHEGGIYYGINGNKFDYNCEGNTISSTECDNNYFEIGCHYNFINGDIARCRLSQGLEYKNILNLSADGINRIYRSSNTQEIILD